LPRYLAGSVKSGFDPVASHPVGDLKKLVRNNKERCLALRLAGGSSQFLLSAYQMTNLVVCEGEGSDEVRLWKFLGFPLDHNHLILCAYVDEIQVAGCTLAVDRIRHELAVDPTDANCPNRSGEGDVGNTQGRARAIDKENVGVVFAVRAEKDSNNLCFVKVALGEERTKWAVRHPAGKSFFFGRTPLSLEITAGKFAHGCRFFAVVHGQRKKVLTFLDRGCGHRRNNNNGVARTDGHCAIGQSRQFACFDVN
jgi:hypothetical protein